MNLIERYVLLKNNYRNYDTKHALRRMQAFRIAIDELEEKGYRVAIEILGSINFGIVEPSSDIDCILLHYCDIHGEDECPEKCPNFVFETQEIRRLLRKRLSDDQLAIEFLDCVNLNCVSADIKNKKFKSNSLLERLMFYRTIGRPVNRPLFINYCNELEETPEFLEEFMEWASNALKDYLKTSSHRFSFNKYNERIESHGLQLPEGFKEELREYLESVSENES